LKMREKKYDYLSCMPVSDWVIELGNNEEGEINNKSKRKKLSDEFYESKK